MKFRQDRPYCVNTMTGPLSIRLMTPSDLPFADSLRAAAGWNQPFADWRRLLAHDPQGCFLATWNGKDAATITTTTYGPQLAWIGMLLVAPDFRRLGIGTALLRHAVEHLRANGVKCIKLDATPEGKPIYEQLGFQCEWNLNRWEHSGVRAPILNSSSRVRPATEADFVSIVRLDADAFGTIRQRWLAALLADARAVMVTEVAGEITGAGVLRDGAHALYIGPLVTGQPSAARELLSMLLAQCRDKPVFWDIPQTNEAAFALANEFGFVEQRLLVRMRFGPPLAANVSALYAIAGPEVG